jgi:hypothetical protein
MNAYKIPFRETEDEVIDKIVKQFKFEPNDLFIDVGCGNGIVLEQIIKHVDIECIGIEIDQKYYNEAVQRLSSRKKVKLLCDDLRTCDLIFPDRRCLYFIAWTKTYISNFDFRRMTKPGDYIFAFKHEIPNMRYCAVYVTTPYNNLYVYKIL